VLLHRAGGAVTYPARFQLVLAGNPCGCGKPARECECVPQARRRYAHRLSGPLMDRIDLRVQVEPVAHADLLDLSGPRETSAAVAARVAEAREAAAARWRGHRWTVNGAVPGSTLRSARWLPSPSALSSVAGFFERGQLSARGFDRVLRLAWTMADLAGRDSPTQVDLSEALFFRTGWAESCAA
jgi:magnesium chelatase family protein